MGSRIQLVNKDGVWWHDAPLPPEEHKCWAQTSGWTGRSHIERCPCGAVRLDDNLWFARNSRTGG